MHKRPHHAVDEEDSEAAERPKEKDEDLVALALRVVLESNLHRVEALQDYEEGYGSKREQGILGGLIRLILPHLVFAGSFTHFN